MGARLVAEFKPVTSQYFHYTQDQINSIRVVTNDAGAVVYAEAHDPYRGSRRLGSARTIPRSSSPASSGTQSRTSITSGQGTMIEACIGLFPTALFTRGTHFFTILNS